MTSILRHVVAGPPAGCGLACASMLSGQAYSAVLRLPGARLCQHRGTTAAELRGFLQALTRDAWIVHLPAAPEALAWIVQRFSGNLACGLPAQGLREPHWVVVSSDQVVYDPAAPAGPVPLARYHRQQDRVAVIVEVVGRR